MARAREIRIFFASPGDLKEERELFRHQIDLLNVGFGDGAGIDFILDEWEDLLPVLGPRSQAQINALIDRCDVFLLAFHRRWGQAAPSAAPCSSFTEEEYYRALERWERTGSPAIFVLFKDVDKASEADPDPQLKEVLVFRERIEAADSGFPRRFETPADLSQKLDGYLRRYAKGERPVISSKVVLPRRLLEVVEAAHAKARDDSERALAEKRRADAELAKAQELAFSLATNAAKAASAGLIDEARLSFAQALRVSSDHRILKLACHFYVETGEFVDAKRVAELWYNQAECNQILDLTNAVLSLGDVSSKRGEQDRAEILFSRALVLAEKTSDFEAIGRSCLGMAEIARAQKKADLAERFARRSFLIFQNQGDVSGMGRAYLILARVAERRKDRPLQQRQLKVALRLFEKAKDLQGCAACYDDLGQMETECGNNQKAEELIRRAIAANQDYGRRGFLAINYQSLATLFTEQGKHHEASQYYEVSKKLYEENGDVSGVCSACALLGRVAKAQKDFALARQCWQRALACAEALSLTGKVFILKEWLARIEKC